jgi:dephospho-CoA kinase
MLRVGLTGGLGSGKSTAARLFAAHGAHVFQSDAIGRELMEPGQAVYAAIVNHFGKTVVLPDGRLDRGALAKIAFADGRVEELNAIVHPAVIARQAELSEAIFHCDPQAIVMVESALIFETSYGKTNYSGAQAGEGTRWNSRFDRIILVTAPEEVKVARFVARSATAEGMMETRRAELEAEARRRLAQQIPDEQKSALCDYVLTNGGALTELEWQVDQLWPILKTAAERLSTRLENVD